MGKNARYMTLALALAATSALATPTLADSQKTIGVTVPYFASPFWKAGLYGVETASKERGYTIIKGDAKDKAELQIEQIRSFIDKKVAAIIIGAADAAAVGPAVEEAIDKGIPVIALSVPPKSDRLTSFVGADNIGMGRLQGICLGRAIGGKGEVGLFAGPDEIWAKLRVTGFKNTMEADFPDIKIVAEKAGGTKDAGVAAAEWAKAYPGMHGMFTAADTMAVESLKTLDAAGAAGKFKVSTSNLNDDARAALQNGTLTCASLQPAVSMGRDSVREAVAAIEGGKVLGRIEAPALLVTKEKVATYDFSKIIAPADYQP
ncbi:sugar ABC transporter substrate-binding protein [Aminobacter anthyllidis]|uniref:Sugar ABC transporter substrate-binding protein n=1 Tax=Aminobacter anthyllidis TaxID=1035067 RepID=A0A9X1AC24_9HYPH|nr:sugar ABC transporter substrate-binding protein [Aminobacter anthyllidis]MBT1156943.1 sugar ABC transporter substrate-binding protein [Aminobacter anthyllidis]